MTPVPMRLVESPLPLSKRDPQPPDAKEVTLRALCDVAQIPCRVTLGSPPKIYLHSGIGHYSASNAYFVSSSAVQATTPQESALRVLEVLAHGFHDYGARECVCRRGLFNGQLEAA